LLPPSHDERHQMICCPAQKWYCCN
jgi:hypothetical protein